MRSAFFVALIVSAFSVSVPASSQTKTEPISAAEAKAGGVTLPTCVYCPAPEYTSRARRAKIQGTVGIQTVVNVEGRAERISVIKGLDSGLDKKAIEAVRKWHFAPAHDASGQPVAISVPVDVTFSVI
jgi:TonB family protein